MLKISQKLPPLKFPKAPVVPSSRGLTTYSYVARLTMQLFTIITAANLIGDFIADFQATRGLHKATQIFIIIQECLDSSPPFVNFSLCRTKSQYFLKWELEILSLRLSFWTTRVRCLTMCAAETTATVKMKMDGHRCETSIRISGLP